MKPFLNAPKKSSATQRHVALVWENMFGTVYARSPKGRVEYFDYDIEAAHRFADVANVTDLRVVKAGTRNWADGYQAPRRTQLVLVGIRTVCECRKPKTHRDCAYCGYTSHSGGKVCGVCAEGGIDGAGVIRGTERRRCANHKGGK